MREIILDLYEDNKIKLSDVCESDPIFAKRKGKLRGMIVHEKNGWILRLGGECGATGNHGSLRKCIESCLEYDYTFHVE